MNTTDKSSQIPQNKTPWHAVPHMRFPSAYLWLVFLSSLDIMLTWVILSLKGQELNPIANAVIQHSGLTGMIIFKYSLTIFVIIMCEIIGRKKNRTAKMLITFGVVLTCIPIFIQFKILGFFVLNHVINPPIADTAAFLIR